MTTSPLFAYQKNRRYFGQIAAGLEEMGAQELLALGGSNIRIAHRGVLFETDPGGLYRINYQSRLFSRFLAPLLRFDCHSTKYLYKTARRLPWQELIGPDQTFAVFANVANSRINHSQYAALCLKDAVVDAFRERVGRRPDVDTHEPDLWLNVHVENNKATIAVDTSGGSLHRRGYRAESMAAPMQETVAAAIIRLTGWGGERPLIDPMCGAGTLAGEALMHYCRIPSGYLRPRFGFEALPDFDRRLWRRIKKEEDARIRPLPAGLIMASDRSKTAVQTARHNLELLPHGCKINIATQNFQDIPALHNMIIVTNPPYGLRLGKPHAAATLLQQIGDFLKQRCTGSIAFLYFGNRELIKKVGLRASRKIPLKNGGLDGRLVKYELY